MEEPSEFSVLTIGKLVNYRQLEPDILNIAARRNSSAIQEKKIQTQLIFPKSGTILGALSFARMRVQTLKQNKKIKRLH